MTLDGRMDAYRRALDDSRGRAALWTVPLLVGLLLVTDGYATQVLGFAAPLIGRAWDLPKGALTPAITLGLLGVMVGACAVSTLADRYGARRVLVGCAGAYGALTGAAALAEDVPTLAALRFAGGLALGGALPTGVSLVSDYSPTRLRATLVTVAVCGFSLGGALGGPVAGLVAPRFGWVGLFVAGGAGPMLLAPVLWLALPESLPRVLSGEAGPRGVARARGLAPGWSPRLEAAAAPPPAPVQARVAGLFAAGLGGATLQIWALCFLNLMVLYTLASWLPTIMAEDGLPLPVAHGAASAFQLGGTIGALAISYLCDRLGSGRVLPWAFLGGSAACLLSGTTGLSPALLAAALTTVGFCVVGGQGAVNAFVGNFYPSPVRASGLGWALGVGRLGTLAGASAVGWLIAGGADARSLYRLCAVPGVFAALAVWRVTRGAARGGSGEAPSPVATFKKMPCDSNDERLSRRGAS